MDISGVLRGLLHGNRSPDATVIFVEGRGRRVVRATATMGSGMRRQVAIPEPDVSDRARARLQTCVRGVARSLGFPTAFPARDFERAVDALLRSCAITMRDPELPDPPRTDCRLTAPGTLQVRAVVLGAPYVVEWSAGDA